MVELKKQAVATNGINKAFLEKFSLPLACATLIGAFAWGISLETKVSNLVNTKFTSLDGAQLEGRSIAREAQLQKQLADINLKLVNLPPLDYRVLVEKRLDALSAQIELLRQILILVRRDIEDLKKK